MKRTILLALVSATFGVVNAQITIPDGTKIRVRASQMISSATAEQGQEVQFEVAEAIEVDSTVLIAEGAMVTGTVTEAHEKRRLGRAGKLDFSIDRVRAADGKWIPLRYTLQKKSGESHVVRTGIITAGVAAVFWPAAPVMLLMKGKDVNINKGVSFDVFTDSAHVVNFNSAPPNNGPSDAPNAAPATATLTIQSPITGADIEVDGIFVGDTPTTIQIQPGNHQVLVKKDSRTWTRTLQVSAGSAVSLMAIPSSEVVTLTKGN